MEKHMDVLQLCVMIPLPTPTWPMMSVRFLRTGGKAETESQGKGDGFYPESSSFP